MLHLIQNGAEMGAVASLNDQGAVQSIPTHASGKVLVGWVDHVLYFLTLSFELPHDGCCQLVKGDQSVAIDAFVLSDEDDWHWVNACWPRVSRGP